MNPFQVFDDSDGFEERLRKVFSYQYQNAPVYRTFCDALGVSPDTVHTATDPPLLPVEAFRDKRIATLNTDDNTLRFKSSGTSGMKRSVHYVPDPEIYRESVLRGINLFYPLEDYVILACTPGYSDNPESSLIRMLGLLIERDPTGLSRFLEPDEPISPLALDAVAASEKKVMLFGAAFGLIDLAEHFPVKLPEDALIVETGGMKTHRREMSRESLHLKLASAFDLDPGNIHSEYGMTELLSQAWADGSGWFSYPHWMRVSIRNPGRPLEELPDGQEGLIGIIDLANVYSCSFLLTGDRGLRRKDGRFMVMGRYIPENLRGCNFLIDHE